MVPEEENNTPDAAGSSDNGAPESDKKILDDANVDKSNTSRIKKSELQEEGAAPPASSETQDISMKETTVVDPMTMRDSDTTRLKRMKPKGSGGESDVTDTVQLKVVKEKKKKLAGILTASQTIRLRPPSTPGQPQEAAQTGDSSKTLKLSGGNTDNVETTKLAKETASNQTLKLNSSPSESDSGTVKVSPQPQQSAASTLKIKSPAATGSGTLKVKAPSTVSET